MVIPDSNQLLTRLLDLLWDANEPGPGQSVKIWPDEGDERDTPTIFVVRSNNDYSLRFRCNGLASLPVCHFRRRWELDGEARQRTIKLLELVSRREWPKPPPVEEQPAPEPGNEIRRQS